MQLFITKHICFNGEVYNVNKIITVRSMEHACPIKLTTLLCYFTQNYDVTSVMWKALNKLLWF